MNTDSNHDTNSIEQLFEWVNEEIKRKSEEIEKLEHSGHKKDKIRSHGRKVGFNQGLRHVREEIADRLDRANTERQEDYSNE